MKLCHLVAAGLLKPSQSGPALALHGAEGMSHPCHLVLECPPLFRLCGVKSPGYDIDLDGCALAEGTE